MKMAELTIENFAGISQANISVNKITILIGPQASGKSVIAKLLYFFNEFLNFDESIAKCSSKPFVQCFKDQKAEIFRKYFPSISWSKQKFSIVYRNIEKNYQIRIYHNFSDNGKVNIEFDGKHIINELNKAKEFVEFLYLQYEKEIDVLRASIDNMEKRLEDLKKELKDIEKFQNSDYRAVKHKKNLLEKELIELKNKRREYNFRLLELRVTLYNLFYFSKENENIFIPANRSFFNLFKESFFKIFDTNVTVDPFFINFGKALESAKRVLSDERESAKLRKWLQKFLKATYKENGIELLMHDDGREVPLYMSSSGQQEILPILLVLYNVKRSKSGKRINLFLEEPESHLFPDTQKNLVELIAEVVKSGITTLFMTTHSPYILTSLNNLIYAGYLSKKLHGDKLNKIKKIIPKKLWINPEDVSIYWLGRNIQLIQDKRTGLILGTKLDKVSDLISREFTKLTEIEFIEE